MKLCMKIFQLLLLVAILPWASGCARLPKIKPPLLSEIKLSRDKKRSVEKLLQVVDDLYEVDTLETAQDSLKYLQVILQIDSGEERAYWRLARCYQWLYENEPLESLRDQYAIKGMDSAGKGLYTNPKSAPCHYYYAISLGLYLQIHNTSAIKGLPKMIEHGKLAVLYGPSFDYAGPHRLLGRIYLEAPSHLGGDLDLALDHLQKAVKLAPNYAENLLALGKAYMEDEEQGQAKKCFIQIYERDTFQDFPRSFDKIQKEALEKVVDLDRNYAEYLLALAKIYLRDQEGEQAQFLLEEIGLRQDFRDSSKELYKIRRQAKKILHSFQKNKHNKQNKKNKKAPKMDNRKD